MWIKKFLPLFLIISLTLVGYFTGFFQALDFETLRHHHTEMTQYVQDHPLITPFLFIAIYTVIIALSIPGKVLLCLISGFLFLQPWSTLYVVIGGTVGATLLFLSMKTSLGSFVRKRVGSRFLSMEKGLNQNAIHYLLSLRLMPFFPFWLTNLFLSFFNIRLFTYMWTTFVGIFPISFLYTLAGRGFNTVFASSEPFSLSSIFNWQIKLSLIFLAILAFLPLLIKKIQKKRILEKNIS